MPFSIQMDARNDGKHAPLDTASLPPLPEPLPIRISGMSPLPPFFPPFFPSFFPPFFICRHSSVLLRDNVSFQGGAVQRNACPVAGWGFKCWEGGEAWNLTVSAPAPSILSALPLPLPLPLTSTRSTASTVEEDDLPFLPLPDLAELATAASTRSMADPDPDPDAESWAMATAARSVRSANLMIDILSAELLVFECLMDLVNFHIELRGSCELCGACGAVSSGCGRALTPWHGKLGLGLPTRQSHTARSKNGGAVACS